MNDLVEQAQKAIIGQGFPIEGLEEKSQFALSRMPADYLQAIISGDLAVEIMVEFFASIFADMAPGGCWRKQNEYSDWIDFLNKKWRWMPSVQYQGIIRTLKSVTLNGIAARCREALPQEYRDCPWIAAYPGKDFSSIFTSEDQLNGYCAAYTNWHIGKLNLVFDKCREAGGFNVNEIAVIDWGCGQGLATVYLNEYLSRHNLSSCRISEVVLIEPSLAALARARYTVERALPACNIATVNKKLNQVEHGDVWLPPLQRVIHLFISIPFDHRTG